MDLQKFLLLAFLFTLTTTALAVSIASNLRPANYQVPGDITNLFVFGSNIAFGADTGQTTFPTVGQFTPYKNPGRLGAALQTLLQTKFGHQINYNDTLTAKFEGRMEDLLPQVNSIINSGVVLSGRSLVVFDVVETALLNVIWGKDDTDPALLPADLNGNYLNGGRFQQATFKTATADVQRASRFTQIDKLLGYGPTTSQDKTFGPVFSDKSVYTNLFQRISQAVDLINFNAKANTPAAFGNSVEIWVLNAYDPFAGTGKLFNPPSSAYAKAFEYSKPAQVAEAIPQAFRLWNAALAEASLASSFGVIDAASLFNTHGFGVNVPTYPGFVASNAAVWLSSSDPLVPNTAGHTALANLIVGAMTSKTAQVQVADDGTLTPDPTPTNSGTGSANTNTNTNNGLAAMAVSVNFGNMIRMAA